VIREGSTPLIAAHEKWQKIEKRVEDSKEQALELQSIIKGKQSELTHTIDLSRQIYLQTMAVPPAIKATALCLVQKAFGSLIECRQVDGSVKEWLKSKEYEELRNMSQRLKGEGEAVCRESHDQISQLKQELTAC
jgi:hypothetical protein